MSHWQQIFGRKIPGLRLAPAQHNAAETISGRLSDTFAGVAHHVFRRLDYSETWPSHSNDDIGSFFVDSERQTAVVLQHQRRIAIGLFAGLGKSMLDLAARAAGHGSVFPDAIYVGSVVAEQQEKLPSFDDFWNDYAVPEERRALASNLLLQMMEFVVLHELSHVDRGHLSEREAAGELAFVDEAMVAGHRRLNSLQRYKEFEADLWSVQLYLEEILEESSSEDFTEEGIFARLRVTSFAWLVGSDGPR